MLDARMVSLSNGEQFPMTATMDQKHALIWSSSPSILFSSICAVFFIFLRFPARIVAFGGFSRAVVAEDVSFLEIGMPVTMVTPTESKTIEFHWPSLSLTRVIALCS